MGRAIGDLCTRRLQDFRGRRAIGEKAASTQVVLRLVFFSPFFDQFG